jgi:hypothetical protein
MRWRGGPAFWYDRSMKPGRRKLLATLPFALTPAASDEAVQEALTRLTADGCAAGCAEGAVHDQLRAAVEETVDGRPVPPALLQMARCPFCGRGFGAVENAAPL